VVVASPPGRYLHGFGMRNERAVQTGVVLRKLYLAACWRVWYADVDVKKA